MELWYHLILLQLISRIAWIMLSPEVLVIIPLLRGESKRDSDRPKRNTLFLKLVQTSLREGSALVDAVYRDTVTRTGDVKAPVPRSAHVRRLRVERIVPAANDDLDPPFDIAR